MTVAAPDIDYIWVTNYPYDGTGGRIIWSAGLSPQEARSALRLSYRQRLRARTRLVRVEAVSNGRLGDVLFGINKETGEVYGVAIDDIRQRTAFRGSSGVYRSMKYNGHRSAGGPVPPNLWYAYGKTELFGPISGPDPDEEKKKRQKKEKD